jgi:hypothetical protein
MKTQDEDGRVEVSSQHDSNAQNQQHLSHAKFGWLSCSGAKQVSLAPEPELPNCVSCLS